MKNNIIPGLVLFCTVAFLPNISFADKMSIGFVEQIDSTVDVPDTIKQNLKNALGKIWSIPANLMLLIGISKILADYFKK